MPPLRVLRKPRLIRPLRTDPPRDDAEFNRRRLKILYELPPVRTPTPPPVSKLIIARYARMLAPIVDQAWAIVDRTVLPVVDGLADQARKDAADGEARTPPPDLSAALGGMDFAISVQIEGLAALSIAVDIAPQIADAVTAANSQEMRALGLRVITPNTKLAATERRWLADNASLIKSIPRVLADRVRADVATAMRKGQRWETLAKRLREEHGIAKDRAALIARDQCSKYNGELTRTRQIACGIQYFTWLGANDDRERDSHRACNNHVFAWGNPPIIGYPGTPYRCRCRAAAATSREQISRVQDWDEAEFAKRSGDTDKSIAGQVRAFAEFKASRTNPATAAPFA